MLLSVMQAFLTSGRLPNTKGAIDPSIGLPTSAQIDALSDAEVRRKINELSSDALLARVFSDASLTKGNLNQEEERDLLKEVRSNLVDEKGSSQLTWGTGALASSVKLAPGEKAEISLHSQLVLSHHLMKHGHEMGHMYANWYGDAAQVNRFLCTHYEQHHAITESFAATLADTSFGDAIAFAWSSQLSTLVFNTWWIKDGSYAI
jgi:hypothetical protein